MDIDVSPLRHNSVGYVHGIRDQIDMNPTYQRQGAIWPVDKQQLLIDSLLNNFDIPKIYFHQFATPMTIDGRRVRYALVDGKQRLEAIWGYLDNAFPLGDDFVLFDDPQVSAAGLTYNELSQKHPELAALMNATSLDIVAIRTDDLEMIEEMFSRLNEAVPLNAAEKRNAIGGPARSAVLSLVTHEFFSKKLGFSNKRYRHYDLAAKFLLWADDPDFGTQSVPADVSVRDVKKYRLDAFFHEVKDSPQGGTRMNSASVEAMKVLDSLASVFVDNDRMLLSSVSMVSLYFLLFQLRLRQKVDLPQRADLVEFDRVRHENRAVAEDELEPAQYNLLEFDRLAQSPNDRSALEFRLRVLDDWLTGEL